MFSLPVEKMQSSEPAKPTSVNDPKSTAKRPPVLLSGLAVEVKDLQMAIRMSARSCPVLPKGCGTSHKVTKKTAASQNTSRAMRLKAAPYMVRGKHATKAGQRIDVERSGNSMKLRICTDKKVQEIARAARLGALMTGLTLAEQAKPEVGQESVTEQFDKMEIVED